MSSVEVRIIGGRSDSIRQKGGLFIGGRILRVSKLQELRLPLWRGIRAVGLPCLGD